jgi:succinyl-diaminopimelate desuccinylase
MKSGLAAMVYVLTHLEETPACDIQFLATCDEERSGIGAFAAARDGLLADNASCMLIGEPTGMHPGTVQKGCLWLQLVVRGRTSHGAYPQEGVSAIHSGMRIADGLCEYVASFQSELLGPSTAQVTMIRGGVAPNMTADECTITMDIRMVPGLTAEMVLAQQEKLFEEIRRKKCIS